MPSFSSYRIAGMINGFFQILFQLILISTGNLSFLNWLTIMPSIWFFDDKFFSSFFTTATLLKVYDVEERRKTNLKSTFQSRLYRGVHVVVALLISYLSYPIVLNLLNSKQVMNTSYEPFRIVNTYGAFGHVTKNRTEASKNGRLQFITSPSKANLIKIFRVVSLLLNKSIDSMFKIM